MFSTPRFIYLSGSGLTESKGRKAARLLLGVLCLVVPQETFSRGPASKEVESMSILVFNPTILEVVLVARISGFVGFLTALKGGARMGYQKGYQDGFRKGLEKASKVS